MINQINFKNCKFLLKYSTETHLCHYVQLGFSFQLISSVLTTGEPRSSRSLQKPDWDCWCTQFLSPKGRCKSTEPASLYCDYMWMHLLVCRSGRRALFRVSSRHLFGRVTQHRRHCLVSELNTEVNIPTYSSTAVCLSRSFVGIILQCSASKFVVLLLLSPVHIVHCWCLPTLYLFAVR